MIYVGFFFKKSMKITYIYLMMQYNTTAWCQKKAKVQFSVQKNARTKK